MEVFLRGVPKDLADDTLRQELLPLMQRLGIEDWSCDKPKKKTQAWLTFLRCEDGAQFLERHGKVIAPTQPRSAATVAAAAAAAAAAGSNNVIVKPYVRRGPEISKLCLLQADVYAEKSAKEPDHLILSHLLLEKDQRESRAAPASAPTVPTTSCRISSVACGKMIFEETNSSTGGSTSLVFARQTECTTAGHAQFKRKSCILTTVTGNQMHIPYATVEDCVFDVADGAFTMILNESPRFYTRNTADPDLRTHWCRMPVLSGWPELAKYVAHCLVYRFRLADGDDAGSLCAAVKEHHDISASRHTLRVERATRQHAHDYLNCMADFQRRISILGNNPLLLPFSILFQVHKMVWNNYLHPKAATIMLDIMERLAMEAEMEGRPRPFSVESFKRLFNEIPYPTPGVKSDELDPFELLNCAMEIESGLVRADGAGSSLMRAGRGETISNQQAWVLKATVTPTRIVLSGPDAESKNRVLRMFHDRTDYFLRVTFTDEDGSDLSFNPRVSNDYIYDHYRSVMKQGIEVAGRRFSFLGFSHSSLRSHSAWFMAPFVDNRMGRQDYATVLSSLGDFSGIRIPAKCAARIGQAFSETPYAVSLRGGSIVINYIEDVHSAVDNSRVFSDGVGTISQGALEDFWAVLPLNLGSPTCVQIRVAGIKGMLSLDPRLLGKQICIRAESMMKFPSHDFVEIGICEVAAKPLRLVLNRQMIKILEDMGTDPAWFKAMQAKALETLRGVTATVANTCTFLEYQGVGANIRLPRFIRRLHAHGIDYRRDPFLKAVVEYVVLRELRLLKHKARIPVDKGVTLFGVMDETAFLKEGEVYIHYDKRSPGRKDSIEGSLKDGIVVITRSPALHPGDIQMAKMVTPPEKHPLRALRNCVVFSQRGDRDLPSQLSGGDLDGDKYNIIWDEGARPKTVFVPASYPRNKPQPLDRDVTREDIANFFIEFMRTDVLGLIANRHLVYADIQPKGTDDATCVKLAELHSTAVDYSKTGIPPLINEIPRQPKTRPDFTAPAPPTTTYSLGELAFVEVDEDEDEGDDGFGRPRHRYHKSEKILGELYRAIDEKNLWARVTGGGKKGGGGGGSGGGPSVWEQVQCIMDAGLAALGIRLDWRGRLDEARKVRRIYETGVLENMQQFSHNPRASVSETEAFCGDIINKAGAQSRQQRDLSLKLRDEMDRLMSWIVKLIRNPEVRTGAGSVAGSFVLGDGQVRPARLQSLEMAVACFQIELQRDAAAASGTGKGKRGAGGGSGGVGDRLRSFRVIAAASMLNELEAVTKEVKGEGMTSMALVQRSEDDTFMKR
ncbi:RNA-dependent RNA polymerase [Cordyceps javanica]|uniref:RNA-dependent RNA polymerase n=1 Tax=Cordyceps javanica TaxID=43265 RepID=A0A545VP84_9HYPO|nr:RNA-dependent RNA polymerase [Cordyceps javanica]TQW03549.1 RNA-dependent RNA polymerase [Cordyceps javanica]